MQKIVIALLLTFSLNLNANNINECRFLTQEIQKYLFKMQNARDKYEYDKFRSIRGKYIYNYERYCNPRNRNTQPFRDQSSRTNGYLGY